MNAKKLAVAMSALVLGLTSCGGNSNNGLTRKEAETKLDEIVAATPATQTKLTSTNGTTSPTDAIATTYTSDAASNYSHIKFANSTTITIGTEKTSVNELFAYQDGTKYVFGFDGITDNTAEKFSITIDTTSADKVTAAGVAALMTGFAQSKINEFVTCGREHWHNGAGGLSAYLKRQDTLDQNKKAITVSDTTIEAGATEKGSYIVLADEKYSSTGAGNLTLDFDALYPNPEQPAKLHEPLLFEFNNNLLTHWYNKKASNYAGNEWTMDYSKADVEKCTFTASTKTETELLVGATGIVALISAKVAADQPTTADQLYPAKWGTK